MSTKFAKALAVIAITLISSTVTTSAVAGDEVAAAPSLYERLGAWDGISKIAYDTLALHHKNPAIAHYFVGIDDDQLAAHVTAFFAAGTGGPSKYEGRDMTTTHAAMHMSDADFDSAVADVMSSVRANGVSEEAQTEVAAILESLRPAVMGTSGT
jgi:hemoglobin